MYAPASPFSRPIPAGDRSMSGLYRQVGVESRGHMRKKDVEAKAKAITRAIRIVDEGLKASLDSKAGGELANNLHGLYTYVCLRLTQANLANDESALDECVSLMEPIREAWSAITPANNGEVVRAAMEVRA
jgi:flagellar secretion chaperone FliS